MVFFQTLLFGGYAYAHLSEKYLRPRWQAVVHVALLAAAVAMLPIAPDASWKMAADAAPTWRILCLLTVSVGLPYFVLSATGPLGAGLVLPLARPVARRIGCMPCRISVRWWRWLAIRFMSSRGLPSAIRPGCGGWALSASRCCAASAPRGGGRRRSAADDRRRQ